MSRTPLDAWIGNKIGRSSHWTRADLHAWQLHKLNETLSLVRSKSRFYRQHLAAMPEFLNSVDKFAEFPFTTAADIRRNPLQFVCNSQDEITRVVTLQTSGTTGNPKRLYFTKADQELTIDFFAVGMSTLVGAGDRVMICLPGHTPGSVGDLLRIGLQRIGAVPFPFGSIDHLQEALDFIRQYRPTCLAGSPMQMLGIARRWYPELPSPKKLLLSTDYLTDCVIETLQNTWHCEIFDHYGSTEMGLGGGVECTAHQGLHMREADMLFEIIDPQSGKNLPPGEMGEVVFTTLTRSGMPLIRYRTGDWSRNLPGKCVCGSEVLRLANPRGRLSNDWLVNGNLVGMKELDEIFLRIPGALHVQYILEEKAMQIKLLLLEEKDGKGIMQAVREAGALVGKKIRVEMNIQPEYMVSLAKRRMEQR